MAEAAIAANNGVADASLKAQAQRHGMGHRDRQGRQVHRQRACRMPKPRPGCRRRRQGLGQVHGLAQAGWEMGRDMVEQARAHNGTSKRGGDLDGRRGRGEQYAQQMAAPVVWSANKSVAAMAEEHAYLVKMMEALAEQQRQAEDQGNGAARGVEDLRMRLLELSGTEEQIARARRTSARCWRCSAR